MIDTGQHLPKGQQEIQGDVTLNEEAFFESRRSGVGFVILVMGLFLIGGLGKAIEDESGATFLLLIFFLIIVIPTLIIIQLRRINKKVPLIRVSSAGLTIRPTHRDASMSLAWNDIEQINRIKFHSNQSPNFLLIHTVDSEAEIKSAPHILHKRFEKINKAFGTPFCLRLDGFSAERVSKLTAAIERFTGQEIGKLPTLKYQQYYREALRANDGIPPTSETFDVALEQAKTPKEVVYGRIIATILILGLMTALLLSAGL